MGKNAFTIEGKKEILINGNACINISSLKNAIMILKDDLQYIQALKECYRKLNIAVDCCTIEKENILIEIIRMLEKI